MTQNFSSLVKRYGTALYEAIAEQDVSQKKPGFFDDSMQFILVLRQVFTRDILRFFNHPVLTHSEKSEILHSFFKGFFGKEDQLFSTIKKFFDLVLQNKRFLELSSILQFVLFKADERKGIKRAVVSSVTALYQEDLLQISTILSGVLKKNVLVWGKLDETLKAGIVVELDYFTIDASLRTRLLELKGFLG